MTSPVALTDAEAALVCGGATTQTISISVTQRSTSTISETAATTNTGRISAQITGINVLTTTIGAESSSAAIVLQANVVEAINFRFGSL